MRSKDYWQLFVETGAPELYLMYTRQMKLEAGNVSDDPGYRSESYGLQ